MLHFHSHCSNTRQVLPIHHRGLTMERALSLQPLQVTAFQTGDAKVHLCCLGCFVVASFRGYRRSILPSHAHAAMCGDLLNPGLSTIAKRQKGFYLAMLHVGAQTALALFNASSTGNQERTLSSTSFAPYHKGFLCKSFPVLLRQWAASSASSNLNRRCQEKHKYSCSGSNTEKSPH